MQTKLIKKNFKVTKTEADSSAKDSMKTSIDTASQWQLMRWRFLKHKAAVASLVVLSILYIVAVFCEFLAPYATDTYNIKYMLAPPQRIHFIDEISGFSLRPFVYD